MGSYGLRVCYAHQNLYLNKKQGGAEGNYYNLCNIHLLQLVTLFPNINSVISHKATLQDYSIYCSRYFFENHIQSLLDSFPD